VEWTLKRAIESIGSLLEAQTYAELQKDEETLKEKGVTISDDFIMTDNRQSILEGIRRQFQQLEAPTVILTGWFGSGKTALLHRLLQDLKTEHLCYGELRVDPIEIRLNEQNTLSLFLKRVLESIAGLESESWVVSIYEKEHPIIGLPPLKEASLQGILITLVGTHITMMAEVVQFLEEIFKEYKRAKGNQRVVALVIDELENITEAALQVAEEEKSKLYRLLRILFDNSVREYIDNRATCRSPFVLILFSITTRKELEEGKWLRQDSLDRWKRVERDVNLSRDTAEFLMKSMLRLYFSHVVGTAAKSTQDPRLQDWGNQLNSAANIEDPLFTYPIMPDIHEFFARRLLLLTADGSVLRFRAYQVGLLTLLQEWPGDKPVNMRFAIEQVSRLRFELAKFPGGVNLDNLTGAEQVGGLINQRFRGLREGQKYQLANLTLAAITKRSTPMVMIRHAEVSTLLPAEQILTKNAFAELCKHVQTTGVKGWSVSGDMLCFDVPEIISQLEKPVERVKPEERLQELLVSTAADRHAKGINQLFEARLSKERLIECYVDIQSVLHIKVKTGHGPLIEEFLLAFDVDKSILVEMVGKKKGCCVAALFEEEPAARSEDIHFKVSVILPDGLQARASRYEVRIRSSLAEEQRWQEKFQPLIMAIVKRESSSYYRAFQEAMKVMLLLPTLRSEDRAPFSVYALDLEKPILDALSLEDPEREEWIRLKLGFKYFHDIVPTNKLIKVLSWLEAQEETLFYPTSDEVRPKLHRKFNVPLTPAPDWRQEVSSEWAKEDFVSPNGRLLPFESWSEERKGLYELVEKGLGGKQLGFNEIGKMLFGDCYFHILKAQTALHLFLKLGKVRPFGWKLSDDVDDYSTMKVTSGELLHQQELRRAHEHADRLLHHLVLLSYEYPEKAGDVYASHIKWVLERRAQLNPKTPLATIQQLASELQGYELPSLSPKLAIQQELISKCPSSLPKLGEFLTQLNRLTHQQGWFPFAVSRKVSGLLQELDNDLTYEQLMQRLTTLYNNWGQPCPLQVNEDRLVVRIAKEYSEGYGAMPGWVDSMVKEVDTALNQKIAHLQIASVDEDSKGVCDWLDEQVSTIIKPSWKRTFLIEEQQQRHGELESAQLRAKTEIANLAEKVTQALHELDSAQRDPAFFSNMQALTGYRTRLQQDASTLAQLPNMLFQTKFGPTMTSIEAHQERWQTFYISVRQAQSEKITSWLQNRGLEVYRGKIEEAMGMVNMSVSQLDKHLRERGIDVVRVLHDSQAIELLAIFAAAQLLEALGMEEQK
jgi:hypothetical protein